MPSLEVGTHYMPTWFTTSIANLIVVYAQEKVDFDDPRNTEHLFRDYWYIIKDSESFSLSDLKAAKRRFKQTGDGNKSISEDYEPEPDSSTSFLPEEESRKRKCKPKSKVNSLSNRKCRSKMRNFIKWGSEELIGFLVSIGRNVDVSLSQGDVERVVKDYVVKNDLYEPGKKKKFVLCDEKLRALFGKRRVKFCRIYKLLEEHFPGSQGDMILLPDSDDEEQREESAAMKKRKFNVGGPSDMQDAGSVWYFFCVCVCVVFLLICRLVLYL
jgi:SWIB/MDM2 domain